MVFSFVFVVVCRLRLRRFIHADPRGHHLAVFLHVLHRDHVAGLSLSLHLGIGYVESLVAI